LAPAAARLRYTAEEARYLAELYPEGGLILEGQVATESVVKTRASEFQRIHFATHGKLNKRNPLFSSLMLEAGGEEDGRLEVHEILRLDLAADLVSLSACETALGSGYFGSTPAGDDFVGLTRAFLVAGASSVLASLWEVDDRSTPEFMRDYYRNLSDNSKGEALALAQRKAWRSQSNSRHPYFWAPFVLVGAMR